MKVSEIRQAFLDFFADKEHSVVASSSLIPANDPTLLFTNAGMVQFKDIFLGIEKANYTRATSAQRCVRAGGKHNDLENVGYTARHHTFFEMLGNFSFGDYFKRDAIRYAWTFLTDVLGLPAEKLWVTVFKDDKEAEEIWFNEIGIDQQRFSRCGEKDNFWSMGDTGPCGPCTEIFYDHGPEIAGGPPGSPDEDGDRYIEIWNLVFMQYNRDAEGNMTPLPKPCVDTGMGLERIAAVMQHVHTNYEIDLFESLLSDLSELLVFNNKHDFSMHVIADHIRSCAFLVNDGVTPSNEGRGYVLRRIIRRAVRHGHKLGCHEPFFHKMVAPLCKVMKDAYPELLVNQDRITATLQKEEALFSTTLANGLKIFEQAIADLDSDQLPGETVFTLYDTYGFPVDLTEDLSKEKGLTIDHQGFQQCMAEQRKRSQKAGGFSYDYTSQITIEGNTAFVGYEKGHVEAKIIAMLANNLPVLELNAGDKGAIVLDQTVFYAESGGQVGDSGVIRLEEALFEVVDTQKQGDVYLHIGEMITGNLKANDTVVATINSRDAIKCNHSATHLLHAALKQVLGAHVIQKGSSVDADKLRFDFTHDQPLSQKELAKVERLVNQEIQKNLPVAIANMSLDAAKESGAQALFGEKYGDSVRVISMGDFSKELCGGTHVDRTGDIGLFKITSEGASASGIRRIEAVTGQAAIAYMQDRFEILATLSTMFKTDPSQLTERVEQLNAKVKELEKSLKKASMQSALNQDDLLSKAKQIGDMNVLAVVVDNIEASALRELVDHLRDKLGERSIVFLAAKEDDKLRLVCGVAKALTKQIKAGDLLKSIAEPLGGKGGGRPDFAQGGATYSDEIEQLLNKMVKNLSD